MDNPETHTQHLVIQKRLNISSSKNRKKNGRGQSRMDNPETRTTFGYSEKVKRLVFKKS